MPTATPTPNPNPSPFVFPGFWALQVHGSVPAAPVAGSSAASDSKTWAQPHASGKAGLETFTMAEVAKHNKPDDCWVVIGGKVLDVTAFRKDHPGGEKSILLYAGKDATEEFNMLHEAEVIEKYAPEIVIGRIA